MLPSSIKSTDLLAGLAIAAVEIPTALAYAELAGFPPVVGLYASILPLVAYALFGSSPQLIVGPDAATLLWSLRRSLRWRWAIHFATSSSP